MKYILYLIFMNIVLFLPRYFVGIPKNWNPLRFLFSNDAISHKVKSLYFSRIIDPFRLSFEYTLGALFISFMGLQGSTSFLLLTIISLCIFVFNIYVGVFLVLLKKTPIIKNDLFFLRESISIYKGYFVVIILAVLALLSILFYGFYLLNFQLGKFDFEWTYGLFLLMFAIVMGFWNVKFYNVTDYLSRSVFSVFIFFRKSQKQSQSYERLFKLSTEDIRKHNHFEGVSLKVRPNIHIISMESYGSVLLRDKKTYREVKDLLDSWDKKFKASDIHCASIYSIPPLFATGTWYSYSTLLFGTTIDNGALQNILFSEMANFEEYQSLFQYTKSNGYTNYVLQGMIGEFEGTLDFKKLEKNLNYDHLIYNKDLEYNGQLLKFMNLQNCVPDQHTLNRGLDIARASTDPYTLFFCTLNAHWDFYSPITTAQDWKDLAKPDFTFETTAEKSYNRIERYKHAVKYTIDSVFEAIMNRMSSNDIFIVYGDHQPTMITDEKFGKETPMHIFSHNEEFIKHWEEYGFRDGLIPQEGNEKLKFEAFYSAFMKCVNATYGSDQELDLPFFKDGVELAEED